MGDGWGGHVLPGPESTSVAFAVSCIMVTPGNRLSARARNM